jgi:hypothetical protein
MTTPDLDTPLDPSRLSAEAQRALTGGARIMAARGLAPLSDPRDLVSVLYQLSRDRDGRVADAAKKTAAELPENLTAAALRQPLDPRVLHFFADHAGRDTRLSQLIILNQSTADETIAALAAIATEAEIELIASNEQRLLRHPPIIAAMYANPEGRQATTTRALELAIRNGVQVAGVAHWEELSAAILESGRADEPEPPPDDLSKEAALDRLAKGPFKDVIEETARNTMVAHQMPVPVQIRLTQFGSKQTILELLRSTKKMIARSAIRSPKIKDSDAAKIAGNHALSDAVIEEIARRRDWTKLPTVKLALVKNPKCPLPVAMRLLPFLHEKQIREIARSKGIPSALNAQARKLLMQRGGRGKR